VGGPTSASGELDEKSAGRAAAAQAARKIQLGLGVHIIIVRYDEISMRCRPLPLHDGWTCATDIVPGSIYFRRRHDFIVWSLVAEPRISLTAQ
jgi:hypothetical protein